jgi:hypothetical protein
MERHKRTNEAEVERKRQTIGKQVFLQVVQHTGKNNSQVVVNEPTSVDPPQPQQRSPKPTTPNNPKETTPRRQWDKTPKTLMDLENGESFKTGNNNVSNALKNNSNSTSSMSTPSSSASQSPPMAVTTTAPKTQSRATTETAPVMQTAVNTQDSNIMSVDLSRAYHTRDEVTKAIDSLKDQFGKEATNINMMLMGNNTAQNNNNNNANTSSPASSGKANLNDNMMKEIEMLNGKLGVLQSEIHRLTLLQQNPSGDEKQQIIKTKPQATAFVIDLNSASFNLAEEKKSQAESNQTKDNQNSDGPFFISIGNGTAKREKPPTLTPKKNLIFVKSKIFLLFPLCFKKGSWRKFLICLLSSLLAL